jgi:hypothetical protein
LDSVKKGFGALTAIPGQMKTLAGALKQTTIVQKLLNSAMLMSPITWWIVGIVALIAILVVMYNKFDWFREFVNTVFEGIKVAVEAVINWVRENWPLLLAILLGPFGLLVYGVVKYWDEIVAFVQRIPERLRAIGTTIWSWITDRWNEMRTAVATRVSDFVAFVRGLPERVRSAAAGMWNGIRDGFRNMLNNIISWWNDLRFDLKIPKNRVTDFLRIGGLGFTLDTPNIPQLAAGGIIMPSPGGTLARIGEAGRAERVEPLDPDGLSKRDKAMITMLSGGVAGGVTINVSPSPGMDEVELASLISRQLAFQLRAGSI